MLYLPLPSLHLIYVCTSLAGMHEVTRTYLHTVSPQMDTVWPPCHRKSSYMHISLDILPIFLNFPKGAQKVLILIWSENVLSRLCQWPKCLWGARQYGQSHTDICTYTEARLGGVGGVVWWQSNGSDLWVRERWDSSMNVHARGNDVIINTCSNGLSASNLCIGGGGLRSGFTGLTPFLDITLTKANSTRAVKTKRRHVDIQTSMALI